MKIFCKLAMCALVLAVMAGNSFAQDVPQTTLTNLTEGQGTALGNTNDWEGWSEIDLIPGGGLFGVTSKSTIATLGFSAGSVVDISNMVLYTTSRASNIITAVKKVTYTKKANPSIDLASTAVCPVQPVSLANPCFIKLDAIKVALSPLNDYYLVVYYTSDSNNNSMRGAGSSTLTGALSGWLIDGDDTRIPLGGTIPVGYTGAPPVFLMALTNE